MTRCVSRRARGAAVSAVFLCAILAAGAPVLVPRAYAPILVSRAYAHGDAAWIMLNAATRACCGPQDCHALPEGSAHQVGIAEWVLPALGVRVREGDKNLYASIDDRWWVCLKPDGGVRCVFKPVPAV